MYMQEGKLVKQDVSFQTNAQIPISVLCVYFLDTQRNNTSLTQKDTIFGNCFQTNAQIPMSVLCVYFLDTQRNNTSLTQKDTIFGN